ncbi:MAG: aminopeptidase [bacterium]
MSKIDYVKMEKELSFEKRNAWEVWSDAEMKNAMDFSEGYKNFLNEAKTEREAVLVGVDLAKKNGFKELGSFKKLIPGDKVYFVNKNKSVVFAIIGDELLSSGLKVVMSHIDVPHLDLKVNPLYEDESLAFLKTHYYGGIKKYHWPTIPLALHGTVILANGEKREIKIGEKSTDPIFMITDLLPHLGKSQAKKPLDEAIAGEELNILVGSMPVKSDKIKAKVKLAILKHLNDEYGMKSEDFFSADLQAAPESKARDLGFDRSMIAAYGQDDRVCAYASLMSIFKTKTVKETQVCLWIDREEIGSEGSTGAQSMFIENFVADIAELTGEKTGMREVGKIFSKSSCLSSDVTAGLDPDYKGVHDLMNVAKLGYGVALERYTGHRGKSGTSEASAEFVQKLRKIFNDNNIVWQTGGLGKVDEGGGGTIAMFMAKRNMEVIDIGVALFNMHAPMEIASKADIYSAYLAYVAYYQN